MTLETQVVSLELAKKLKELGVKQESYFYWNKASVTVESSWSNVVWEKPGEIKERYISAFTVAELGEMLWKRDIMYMPVTINKEWCGVDTNKGCHVPLGNVKEHTEADARAKMLIYLLENGLIEK